MADRKDTEPDTLLKEHCTEVVWLYDPEADRFRYVSPSVFRQRGITAEEAQQEGLDQSMTLESSRLLRERIAVVLPLVREDPSRIIRETHEIRHFRKDGDSLWVEATLQFRRNGRGGLEVIASCRDVERRKEIERELEQERIRAAAAITARTEFLANMSHEFRTPLSAVIGFLDLTLRTDLTAEQAEFLHKGRSAAAALLRSIDAILDYSRLESGILQIETAPFRLSRCLSVIRETLGEGAEEKGLTFSIEVTEEVPAVLLGDSRRLEEVLTYLVGNAVKFTQEGCVSLHVAVLARREDHVTLQFTVSDTGIGMAQEEIERLFAPFVQADGSSTRRYGGTGLGLTVAGTLVTMMGGEIHARSEPGNGSVFTFTLEFGLAADQPETVDVPAQAGDTTGPPLTGRRVLVVEDSPFNQQVAREILKRIGVTADVASDGEAALKMILSETPCVYDAVLMDVQMPVMDGCEATRAIRGYAHLAELPVIALTAFTTGEDSKKCYAAGMNDYLVKPIEGRLLRETLSKWIGDGSAEREQETEPEEYPEMAQGVAVGKAVRQLSGRWDLYRQFIRLFVQEYRDFGKELESALAQEDRKSALRLAHTLKGAAGAVGAEDLQRASRNLEQALGTGSDCGREREALLEELERVLGVLDAILPAPADTAEANEPTLALPDRTQAEEKIRELEEMLRLGSFSARRQLPALTEVIPGVERLPEYRSVEKHLSDFAMDRAREALRDLARRLNLTLKD